MQGGDQPNIEQAESTPLALEENLDRIREAYASTAEAERILRAEFEKLGSKPERGVRWLLPKHEDLCFQRRPRSNQIDDETEYQSDEAHNIRRSVDRFATPCQPDLIYDRGTAPKQRKRTDRRPDFPLLLDRILEL